MAVPELASFLALLFVCICHALVFARSCRTHFSSIKHWLASLRRSKSAGGTFAELVRIEVISCLTERVQKLADVSGLALISMFVAEQGAGQILGTETQRYIVAVFMFGLLIIRVCSLSCLNRTLPLCYMFCMICACAYIVFTDTSGFYFPLRCTAICGMMRFSFSLVFCQPGLSVLCNTIATVASSYIMLCVDWSDEASSPLAFIACEIVLTGFITFLTWEARKALERECSHLVRNKSLTVEFSAMTTLLGHACDVVVELDASLSISKHAPNLSAILGTNRDTFGLAFSELIRDESERERFEKVLSDHIGSQKGSCRQDAMVTTLADSMNGSIPVELFFTVFHDPCSSDGSHCFLGVRELADQPIARLPNSKVKARSGSGSSGARVSNSRGVLDKTPVSGTPAAKSTRSLNKDDDETSSVSSAGSRGSSGARVSNSGGVLDKTPVSGTPAAKSMRSLNKDDDETSSVSSTGSRGSSSAWVLTDHRFEHTTSQGKRLSTLELLMQWNIAFPARSCCPYHAALIELRSQTKAMMSSPCFKNFSLGGSCQCEGCGIVSDFDEGESDVHCTGHAIKSVPPRAAGAPSRQLASPPVIGL